MRATRKLGESRGKAFSKHEEKLIDDNMICVTIGTEPVFDMSMAEIFEQHRVQSLFPGRSCPYGRCGAATIRNDAVSQGNMT